MKKLDQEKRPTKGQNRQQRRSAESAAVVRRELEKVSPTARLLKDVAAEQNEVLTRATFVALRASRVTRLGLLDYLRGCEIEVMLDRAAEHTATLPAAAWEVSDCEQFFIAEALRHANRMMREPEPEMNLGRPQVDAYLLGFFGCLHPAHPARQAIGQAYRLRDRREELINQVQLGNYQAAA